MITDKSHNRLLLPGESVLRKKSCARGRFIFSGGLFVLILLLAWHCRDDASASSPTEDQVKVAMVFNIMKYVDWPEESFSSGTAPISISVLGKGELGSALEALHGKTIRGRLVNVRQVSRIEEKTPCQVLVLVKSERSRLHDVLRQVGRQGILTIGDAPHFASAGGVVGFIEIDGRVGLEINQETARRSRIRISSHLLKLAHLVRDGV